MARSGDNQRARTAAAIALLVGAGLFLWWRLSALARPPSVVLIVVDTLRADHLGAYGYPRPTSPALDGLAATRFATALAPSSWTAPSTASILTGLYPARHRTLSFRSPLHSAARSMAELLSEAGYRTLGLSANANIAETTQFNQGFDAFYAFEDSAHDLAYPDASALVDAFASWLPGQRDAPFFAWLQLMNTHGPYRIPETQQNTLLGRAPAEGFQYNGVPMLSVLRGDLAARATISPAMVTSLGEQYDSAVRYSTDQVGRILDLLRTQDRYDDTLVIITSDHGEELFDHGGFSHGYSLHAEVMEVPLWLKLPGQQEAGLVRAPVSLIDLLPTVLDALDQPVPPDLDGWSLLPLLDGDAEAVARFEARPLLFDTRWQGRCDARGLRHQGLTLIATVQDYQGRSGVLDLYRNTTDPHEQEDLSATEGALRDRHLAELTQTLAALEARALPEDADVAPQLDEDRLRALGYLDEEAPPP